MNSMRSVVDHMASELAARREMAAQRRAAYIALARVVLGYDEPAMVSRPKFERLLTMEPVRAA